MAALVLGFSSALLMGNRITRVALGEARRYPQSGSFPSAVSLAFFPHGTFSAVVSGLRVAGDGDGLTRQALDGRYVQVGRLCRPSLGL